METIIDKLNKEQLILKKDYRNSFDYFEREMACDKRLKLLGLTQLGLDTLKLILERISKEESERLMNLTVTNNLTTQFRNIDKHSIDCYLSTICFKRDNLDRFVDHFMRYRRVMDEQVDDIIRNDSRRLLIEIETLENLNELNWDKYMSLDKVMEHAYIEVFTNHIMNIYRLNLADLIIEDHLKERRHNNIYMAVTTTILLLMSVFTLHFNILNH